MCYFSNGIYIPDDAKVCKLGILATCIEVCEAPFFVEHHLFKDIMFNVSVFFYFCFVGTTN